MSEEKQFFEYAEKVPPKDVVYRLQDTLKNIWIVEKGSVDVYLLEKEGQQEIRRHYILSKNKNEFFFAAEMKIENYELFTEIYPNTLIRKLSIDNVRKFLKEDENFKKIFIEKINFWARSIYTNLIVQLEENINEYILLEKKQRISTEKPIILSGFFTQKTKKDVYWLKVDEGVCSFLNEEKITLDNETGYIPMSFLTFVTLEKNAVISLIKTEEFLEGDFENSLNKFINLIIRFIIFSLDKKKDREVKRIVLKKDIEQSLIKTTLSNLLSILKKERNVKVDPTEEDLIKSFHVLSNEYKIDFKTGADDEKDVRKRIENIAENTNVIPRLVVLKDKWYEQDSIHLLGFLKDDKKPVAIIRRRKFFEYYNSNDNKFYKITDKNADKFIERAYVFYEMLTQEHQKFSKILKLVLKRKSLDISTLIITGFLSIFLALYIPMANSLIFNRIIPFLDTSLLMQVSMGLFVAAISGGIFRFVSSFASLRLQSVFNMDLQAAFWGKLLNLPIAFYRKYTIGDLLRRVFSITDLRSILTSSFFTTLFNSVFSLIYIFLMFYYSAVLSFVGIGILSFSLVINFSLIYLKIKIDTQMLDIQGKLNGFVLQSISSVEKTRVCGAENIIYSKWGELYRNMKTKNYKSNTIANMMGAINRVLPTFGMFFIFMTALHLLTGSKKITIGNFIAFNAAFSAFSTAVYGSFLAMSNYFGMIIPRWKRARVILDEPSEIKENKIDPKKIMGFVKLENVYFKYQPELPLVLKGVSLEANPSEMIAIVGSSGCGKSTIVNLLLNFCDPTSGSIYFDGKNLSDLDTRKVRKQMGVVLQDGNILSGSVQENLLCGGIYSKEQVEKAIKLSGFDEVLKDFPMGLQTYLVDNGKNLSGGQKQLLLIARALLGDPHILIFDEATNALDNETQEKVSENIDKLNITRIIIAHRLSTVKNADKIYVIEDGKIVEEGTFDELANKKGLFASYVEKQKL